MDHTESSDFEMINTPDCKHSEFEKVDQKRTEPSKPIHELFDEPKENDILQSIAKIIVLSSVPFALFWRSLAVLLFVPGLSDASNGGATEEDVLDSILKQAKIVVEWYRKKLQWVDDELPSLIER